MLYPSCLGQVLANIMVELQELSLLSGRVRTELAKPSERHDEHHP